MKTLSVYAGLVHGPINIFLLLFLFRIAFTIRALTSLKMELELEPRIRIRIRISACVAVGIVVPEVTFLGGGAATRSESGEAASDFNLTCSQS